VSFLIKIRKKKGDGTKKVSSFEDSIKAKAKLNLLEKRYQMIKSLVGDEKLEGINSLLDVLKLQIIATQGLGEVGDKARPSNESVEGLQELIEMYNLDLITHGKDSEIAKLDEALILGSLVNLLNRSIRREHTNVEIVTVPPELYMPSWMWRAGRESSLAS